MEVTKVKTIWKYGIIFAATEALLDQHNVDNVVYSGTLQRMPLETASQIAEIHPNFSSYFKDAMATFV